MRRLPFLLALIFTVASAADSKTFLSHGAVIDESIIAVPGKITVLSFTAEW